MLDTQVWGITWEISTKKEPSKLQRWIEIYPESGMDVLFILSAVSDVFADTLSLEKKYGITLKQRHPVNSESHRYRRPLLIFICAGFARP